MLSVVMLNVVAPDLLVVVSNMDSHYGSEEEFEKC
jgi:hypothetical protein